MKKYLALAILALLVVAGLWLFEGDFSSSEVDAKFSNQHSKFMTTADGTRVHYRDQGNADGPVIVLVHGSNASLHTWEPWRELLDDTYRVITLDLPGHGLTGAVPSNKYDSAAQIATLNALIQQLALKSFVLGGNSMGGGVSWRYALEYPDQIDALVLVDASGLGSWRQQKEQQEAAGKTAANSEVKEGPLVFRLLQKPWFRRIAVWLDTRYLTGQGLRAAFHDPAKVTEEMIDLYYNMSMRAGTREATLTRFAGFGNRSNRLADADLATLRMPTLVLWGETDALIPASTGERFAAVLPDAKLIVYPNVGHIPMEEIPTQSAADLRAFLQARLPKQPQDHIIQLGYGGRHSTN